MNLNAYLIESGETEAEFARRVGVGQQHINRLRHGKRRARPALARRMVAASGGKIGFADIYAEDESEAAA
jgi:transcriptional regulator with XRE-family HTH domain